jgi:RNA polymerase primary sigma factor
MRRALANQSRTIRIPVQSAGKINRIKAARARLTEELGREPTDGEIADELDVSKRTVAGLKRADLRGISLHEPLLAGEESKFEEVIADQNAVSPEQQLGRSESLERLKELLDQLDDRESLVLRLRYGLDEGPPRTLEEVSQHVGRTRERVRQIQNQALAKLKTLMGDDFFVS